MVDLHKFSQVISPITAAMPGIVSFLKITVFLAVLGFELKALLLLGRHSAA
jgi:hypothetical protein